MLLLHRDKYSLMENLAYERHVESNLRNCISCQAVSNMLEVSELTKEFRDIQRLERVRKARRILF